MKKFCFGIGVVILGFGCGDEKGNQIPKNVLKREPMTEILTEISIAEGRLSTLSYPDSVKDSTDIYARTYYKALLEKHDVSQETFERSFNFYIKNPHIMEQLYDPVIENLQKKEGQSQTKE